MKSTHRRSLTAACCILADAVVAYESLYCLCSGILLDIVLHSGLVIAAHELAEILGVCKKVSLFLTQEFVGLLGVRSFQFRSQ